VGHRPAWVMKMTESVEAAGRSDDSDRSTICYIGAKQIPDPVGIMAWNSLIHTGLGAVQDPVRKRFPTGAAAAPEGCRCRLADGVAAWLIDPISTWISMLRRMRVSEPGTLREVFDLAELILQSPLDISRPLWTPHWSRACRRQGRDPAACQPRGHRRCRQRGDVRRNHDLERDPPARRRPRNRFRRICRPTI